MKLRHKHVWIVFSGVMVLGAALSLGASYYAVDHVSCNTLVFDVKGELLSSYAMTPTDASTKYVTYGDIVSKNLRDIDNSKAIKAIILDVDSFGGSPVGGEDIATALKHSTKETVALIRSAGLSAAYWAATGADHIVASKNSDVGSIGAILELQNLVEKNRREGIQVTSITSGQYKGIGDPNRELTADEKELLQKDVDTTHNNFVTAVSTNRNMPLDQVKTIANGASMLGEKALQNGLVDEIGGMEEVKAYLKQKIGTDVRICVPPSAPAPQS